MARFSGVLRSRRKGEMVNLSENRAAAKKLLGVLGLRQRPAPNIFKDWNGLRKIPPVSIVIDVGVGVNGTPWLYDNFRDAEFILIDPLPESERAAEELKARFLNYALGSNDGDVFLKKFKGDSETKGLSTVKTPIADIPAYKGEECVKVKMTTLDRLFPDEFNVPVGLKIDAEGSELDICWGGKVTLQHCHWVIVEVRHNLQTYENQHSLFELSTYLGLSGLFLSNILTAKPRIADLVFARPDLAAI